LVYNFNVRNNFNSLFEFIRFELCVFASFIGMTGYLLFSPLSLNLVFVALSSFFVCAGGYAYNNITDRKEDLINRKRVIFFSLNNKSYLIVIFSFLIALLFALPLSFYSSFFTVMEIIIGITYSLFRIKKYFLLKNIYTGFGVTQIFLLGAGNITIEIIQYYLLISFFIFIGSIISDLRDYKGDKNKGIRTLPVSLGYNKTKELVYFLLTVFFILILIYSDLLVLLPFALIMFFSLYKNNPSFAHSCGGFSLIFLTLRLMI